MIQPNTQESHQRHIASAEQAGIAIGHLKRHFGELPMPALEIDEQQGFVEARHGQGVRASTISRELSVLRAAIGFYESRHLGAPKPRIYDLEALEPRGRWLTEAEVNRLVGAARSRHVYLFIRLMLATAARPEAVLDLRWEEVDFAGRIIRLNRHGRAQTSKRRPTVPLPEQLRPALQEAFAHRRTDYVIEYGGYPVVSIKKAFRETALRAGFRREDLTPYVLRHTAATWMAQDGVPLWEIAGYLGHADMRMVDRRYAHHHPDFRDRAKRSLDRRLARLEDDPETAAEAENRAGGARCAPSFAPVRWQGRGRGGASRLKKRVGAGGIESPTPTVNVVVLSFPVVPRVS